MRPECRTPVYSNYSSTQYSNAKALLFWGPSMWRKGLERSPHSLFIFKLTLPHVTNKARSSTRAKPRFPYKEYTPAPLAKVEYNGDETKKPCTTSRRENRLDTKRMPHRAHLKADCLFAPSSMESEMCCSVLRLFMGWVVAGTLELAGRSRAPNGSTRFSTNRISYQIQKPRIR